MNEGSFDKLNCSKKYGKFRLWRDSQLRRSARIMEIKRFKSNCELERNELIKRRKNNIYLKYYRL